MIPAFPVYLFDVDGTLMDSAADICGAIQTVLANRGRTDITDDMLRPYIGRHLLDEFLELGFSRDDIEQMIVEYRAIYPARKHASTVVYPGVADALARLGGRKSTATTKGTPTTRQVLEQFGLIGHFDHVQGTDGFAAKHFGFDDVDDYREWVACDGAPLCSERTKKGRLCRNYACERIHIHTPQDWLRLHRSGPCFVHGGRS
jgi:phosphoglycolate phosphatase-like HAD superfamily hydrolase